MPDPKRLAGTLSTAARKALERAAERAHGDQRVERIEG